jgi:hypothetical protein
LRDKPIVGCIERERERDGFDRRIEIKSYEQCITLSDGELQYQRRRILGIRQRFSYREQSILMPASRSNEKAEKSFQPSISSRFGRERNLALLALSSLLLGFCAVVLLQG